MDHAKYRVKQLSIFAENKPGMIAAMAKVMRDNDVNILGFSIAEGAGYGVIRVIVDKPDIAHDMLKKAGFVVKFTDVLAVEMADRPGGLYDLTDMLSRAGVNIEYGYGYRNEPCAVLIIRVEDVDAGIEKILAHGARLLDKDHFQGSCTKRP
ncbi:MAG: acetolactate synthase [Methanomassiliicoccales archaeon]|nr:MAG: acetolactate synthase [Methanomassiliicoccales archaeon]